MECIIREDEGLAQDRNALTICTRWILTSITRTLAKRGDVYEKN